MKLQYLMDATKEAGFSLQLWKYGVHLKLLLYTADSDEAIGEMNILLESHLEVSVGDAKVTKGGEIDSMAKKLLEKIKNLNESYFTKAEAEALLHMLFSCNDYGERREGWIESIIEVKPRTGKFMLDAKFSTIVGPCITRRINKREYLKIKTKEDCISSEPPWFVTHSIDPFMHR